MAEWVWQMLTASSLRLPALTTCALGSTWRLKQLTLARLAAMKLLAAVLRYPGNFGSLYMIIWYVALLVSASKGGEPVTSSAARQPRAQASTCTPPDTERIVHTPALRHWLWKQTIMLYASLPGQLLCLWQSQQKLHDAACTLLRSLLLTVDSQAKVSELDTTRFTQENVLRFDVTVEDALQSSALLSQHRGAKGGWATKAAAVKAMQLNQTPATLSSDSCWSGCCCRACAA
eukprot:GHUV01031692.1.p1 GENE.GHUV01031692.1~~GHUV01031692.1.p1  ORF type:complete len:270 (+),score=56.75 GHUV01031692.1:115-810(+)